MSSYHTPLRSSARNPIAKTPLNQNSQAPSMVGHPASDSMKAFPMTPLQNLSPRELNLLFTPNTDRFREQYNSIEKNSPINARQDNLKRVVLRSSPADSSQVHGTKGKTSHGYTFYGTNGKDKERRELLTMVESLYEEEEPPYSLEDRRDEPPHQHNARDDKILFEYESDLEFPVDSRIGNVSISKLPSAFSPEKNLNAKSDLPTVTSTVDFIPMNIDEEYNQRYNQILSELLSEVENLDHDEYPGQKSVVSYEHKKVLNSKYFERHTSFLRSMQKLLPSSLDLEDPHQAIGKYLLLPPYKLSSLAAKQHEDLLQLDTFFTLEERKEMQSIYHSLFS